MDISGSYFIAADKQTVWQALNDPDVLRACVPGCEELEQTSPTEFEATAAVKVGPVKAKFKGAISLENLNPPNSYTIAGSGKGGVAGFASGQAEVRLEDGQDDDGTPGTQLSYDVDAKVGGKLAQIGGRLIQGTAKKLADDFFEAFRATVTGNAAGDAAGDGADAQQA
jgi:carbon monoxide dehydrogenase subunit G